MREVFMIKQKRVGFSVFILMIASCWLMGYSLLMTEQTIITVRSALSMFAGSVLPPLAIFSVCSKILIKLGAVERLSRLPIEGFLKNIGMSAGGFAAFLIGLFAGFPTGAAVLSELCERGEISEGEAASLLPFCNQAGVIFLIGTVGNVMLGDVGMGIVFFAAQTVTAWLCVCLTAHERMGCRSNGKRGIGVPISNISVLTSAVKESAFSMIGVCGFVVFFSLLGKALFDTLLAIGMPLGELFHSVIGGMLEISAGFSLLSADCFSRREVLILGGMFLGFGGCSVFLQVLEKTEAFFFDLQKYFGGKLLASIICPIFTVPFFFLYEQTNGKKLIIAMIMIVFCVSYLLNYVKIKFFSKKCGKIKRNAV
jgi:hypothetical protein